MKPTNQLFVLILSLLGFLPAVPLAAQEVQHPDSTAQHKAQAGPKLTYAAYGVVNYYAFDWETLPDKRDALDPERFNTYIYYHFTPEIEFKSEIEFEHGGTGATMGFDPLEEFGEFEQEIEKGGQVVLEQVNLLFKIKPSFRIRVGKMRFYMGNASKQDQPREYFTAYRSEVENTILPLGWYETGVELSGDLSIQHEKAYPYLSYKLYLVSGLDNSAFNSANWVRRGYQTRFETINADNLAFALRLDYIFGKDSELGICAYAGNTTGNRPKDDFKSDAWLAYGDVHFALEHHPWRARAYGMYGYLQNSEALSAANRNLSNNLNVKRTPVGETALGAYAEMAYDVWPLISKTSKQQGYLFGRAEYYDSMFGVQGEISDNPRYERRIITLGFNYFPIPKVVLKTHYAWRALGSGEKENTFTLGMGFDF